MKGSGWGVKGIIPLGKVASAMYHLFVTRVHEEERAMEGKEHIY